MSVFSLFTDEINERNWTGQSIITTLIYCTKFYINFRRIATGILDKTARN